MTDPRKPAFDAARTVGPLDGDDVNKIHAALDAAGFPRAAPAPAPEAFDRAKFLARHVNRNAPRLTNTDIEAAASALRCTTRHIRALLAVESGGASFGPEGRPVILFEPHVFHRRTDGRFSPASFSYARWKALPYPKSQQARWEQMADAAARNHAAALESASWGLFQIMGFHWKALGYASAGSFAESMKASEAAQLDAMINFVKVNGLDDELRAGGTSADSWRAFARGYNGEGYAANRYHEKLAREMMR